MKRNTANGLRPFSVKSILGYFRVYRCACVSGVVGRVIYPPIGGGILTHPAAHIWISKYSARKTGKWVKLEVVQEQYNILQS